ncbi:CBS domain-containing protein [Raphidiopsis sp. BLCC-F218]
MSKTVAQVMTHNPIMVNPQTPLKQAIQILAEKQISGLPVVDDMGKLVGIISETDLMWQETGITPPAYIMFLDSVIYLQNPAAYERDLHKALGQTVGEVMSNNPITISPDQSLKAAAKIIQDHKVRRLPVVDDAGTVIGILTRGDIIRTMAYD